MDVEWLACGETSDRLMGCEKHDDCIGSRIKQRRKELNMSQEELALKIGYKSKSSINKIEKDDRGLPRSKIETIAKALGTSPEYIMGWEYTCNAFSDNLKRLLNGEELKTRDTEGTTPKEEMIKMFDSLNTEGQKIAMKQMAFFASLPEFKKGSDTNEG